MNTFVSTAQCANCIKRSHRTLRTHFDALMIALDTLPKEYYKLLAVLCLASIVQVVNNS